MGLRQDAGFADFALKTDQLVFSSMDDIINDASQYRTYTVFEAFKRKRNIGSGNGIKDYVELTKSATAEFVGSDHKFTPQSDDGSVEHKSHYARLANYLYYDVDEEFEDDDDRIARWKAIYKGKRMRKAQDTYDRMEAALWASPDDRMEIAVGTTTNPGVTRLPYSIPALLTNTNASGGAVYCAFTTPTTVMGINPTTYSGWRNQHKEINNFQDEIEGALFRMYHYSYWQLAGGPKDGLMTGTPQDGCVIYADLKSVEGCRQVLRDSNDRLGELGQYDRASNFGQQGKFLTYLGKPIVWAEPLGDADIAETSQVMYGVNWNFLDPWVHKNRFLSLMKNPQGGEWIFPEKPMSRVLYEFSDYNLWMSSRRRHFKITVAAA